MTEKELYDYAIQILNETNVYKQPLEQFTYHCGNTQNSLLRILDLVADEEIDRFWDNRCTQKEIIYMTIRDTFIKYVEEYPCSFAFKQTTKEKLGRWLRIVKEKLQISEMDPEELHINYNELDTAIVLLKELHARDGVTKKDIKDKLGLEGKHVKSIQTNLRKLCPELYTGDHIEGKREYVPFKIGGQPIKVDIQEIGERGHKKEKVYRTTNTLHPIVLQENLMQIGTLIQSLARNYYEYENHVSRSIAIDVWSQLSDYAKERVEEVYAKGDETVSEFINLIKDECPNNHAISFYSEKMMFNSKDEEMTPSDKLVYLEKRRGKLCNVVIEKSPNQTVTLTNQYLKVEENNYEKQYCFISSIDETVTVIHDKNKILDINFD